jgi:regulator of sigma E protease
MITALLVIGILVLLIVAHELGHFIVAKLFNVRVDEFGIGYPPRAFLLGKIGETEYTLNWIPFGGFVRLYGEEDVHKRRGLLDAKPWKQALILIAGVLANAVAAYLLFTVAFMQGVPRIVDTLRPGEVASMLVSDVVAGSPADAGGLIAGDEILSIQAADGDRVKELIPEKVTAFVSERGGQSIMITYVRSHATSSVSMRPANAVVPGEAGRPALGIGLVLVSTQPLSFFDALPAAGVTTMNAFAYISQSLWNIAAGAFRGRPNLSQVVGPVGLITVIGDAAHSGVGYVLELAGFIGVNLAIVNLLPIPALDGGRLAVLVYEVVSRRKSPHLAVQFLNTLGISLIIILMLVVTYHDIIRLLI